MNGFRISRENKLISLNDVSTEELRKWQMKLVEILVYFRDFCNDHNIRFFLAGGSCIGAVRHHGFIPWDDDIDVQMLRNDYDKLLELWDKDADLSRFVCERTTKEKCSRYPMAVIRSVNTTCIYDHCVNDDLCHGLKIDVEFLDSVPVGKLDREINKICAYLLALLRAQRIPRRASFIKKSFSSILLTLLPTLKLRWFVSRLCEKRIVKFNKDKRCNRVRYLACSIASKSCYEDAKWVDFEGYQMPIPIGYDEYMTQEYGDYMQLPPVKDRRPLTENLVFYDLDNCYKKYKGIYYCKNE